MIIKLVNESVFLIYIPQQQVSLIGFRNILILYQNFRSISRTHLKQVSRSGYLCCEKQILIITPAESKKEKKGGGGTICVYFNRKAPSGTYFKGISCFIFKKVPHQQTRFYEHWKVSLQHGFYASLRIKRTLCLSAE